MVKASRPGSTRVTVEGIAAYAGVSIGSVSTVLNNRQVERRIPPATAQKIRDAAAKLGYVPNISARRLRSREGVKNSVLLALVTSFEAPIPLMNHFVAALRREASKVFQTDHTFTLMMEMYSAGHLSEMPGLLTADHFNAALIMNTIAEDDQFLSRSHLPCPVVLVNRSIPGYLCVLEHLDAGVRAAEILIQKRRSRVGVLYGTPLTQTTQNRTESFMKGASRLLGYPAYKIAADELSESAGYRAMSAFLKSNQSIDGLYAVSDALALGAYRAIKEHRLSIPKDVAIIGVGDYEMAPFFDPPLSAVGVSHKEIAEQSCRLLLKQLTSKRQPLERISLPMLEVLRSSSGH